MPRSTGQALNHRDALREFLTPYERGVLLTVAAEQLDLHHNAIRRTAADHPRTFILDIAPCGRRRVRLKNRP
jgi:hypothetical protein